jgi:hypothetical protein
MKENLSSTQLFIAGSILSKVTEAVIINDLSEADEDTRIAFKYVCEGLDNINKEIASEVLKRTIEGMQKTYKMMKE